MTLGQAIHNKKNQEKKDIIELSKDLDISNTIMTWDAINTHSELVEFVISKHADVFASIKSNQKLTFDEIKEAYESYKKGASPYTKTGHNATATDTVMSGKQSLYQAYCHASCGGLHESGCIKKVASYQNHSCD